jgi:predicted aconitase with swiveling domain
MLKKIVLKGRGVVGGVVEGEALVVPTHIHTFGLHKGIITETDHPQRGASIKGKVLVFNSAAGSSDWGATLHRNCWNGDGPVALINRRAITLVLNGAIATSTPTVVDLDRDPTRVIGSGDLVKVDADHGVVEVYKKRLERRRSSGRRASVLSNSLHVNRE